MNRWESVLVLFVAVCLVYAVAVHGFLRRGRRHGSAGVATDGFTGGEDVWVSSRGTYISTTTAGSRYDRVTVGGFTGLGVRAAAVMDVGPGGVTWQRQGADAIHLEPGWLEGVRRDRGMAGKFVAGPGPDRMVVVTWHGADGDRFDSGFLPRNGADTDALLEAVTALTSRPGATIDTDGAQ